MPHDIFVYGTLLTGLENAKLLSDETLKYKGLSVDPLYLVSNLSYIFDKKREGQDEARSKAYKPTDFEPQDDYPYPFMSRKEFVEGQVSSRVAGEVYEVSDEALARMDILEDHPRSYRRQPIEVENLDDHTVSQVDVYMLNSDELFKEIRDAVVNATGQYELLTTAHEGDWKTYLAARDEKMPN